MPPLFTYTIWAACSLSKGGRAATSAYVGGCRVVGGDEEANCSLKSRGAASWPPVTSPGNAKGCPKTASAEERPLISLGAA